MPLNKNRVRFAGAVAALAEGMLGERAGGGDDCPAGDPDCYRPVVGTHALCQYRLAACDQPGDGCPDAARSVGR